MRKIEGLEKKNHIIETYNNSVMPHGGHLLKNSNIYGHGKMCHFLPDRHDLPHWKFVSQYCTNCPNIVIFVQQSTSADTKNVPKCVFMSIQ